ncbi:MAG: outer membrane beta-barrel protein [Muribaculaceae bacterium]|nr:outer membrane beta-barrel protein [Muribaculaceae bacterium]
MNKRLLLLAILLLTIATSVCAVVIKGTLVDENNQPMIGGTLALLHLPDSSQVKAVASDFDGKFSFSDVKSGKYAIRSTYVGYATQITPITVGQQNINLKPITMHNSSIVLKEATVTAVKTPVKVMEDTIEYNADTYKTQPNAVVEDLLKRLPGVEVDANGKITANGKEVTKILVDGKEFFSDDPKVASKNLPVNMVDKLQVVDRKSDLARITGVDDGEDETVINLTVKKGMKNGWFGTAEAGYGTDDRYQATFNVNRFYNDNQFTLLGSANNTNDLGFTDGNGNRFRRFGGDQGINTSQSLGLNFNIGNKEIFRVGGDVMYSHTDLESQKSQNRQYLFPDSTSYSQSYTDSRDRGHNVRADFRIQWKPDSLNTFDFRPRFSFNHNDSRSIDSTLTLSGLQELVTRSYNTKSSLGNSWEANGEGTFNHNFKSHPGRSYSINFRYQMSNVREKTNTYSHNLFKLFNDSIDAYDQFEDNHTWSNQIQARATWTEPLGDAKKGRFLTLSYNMRYRWNNADKLTYDRNLTFPDGPFGDPMVDPELHYVDSLSNSFRNNFFTQDIRLGFKLVKKAYTLDAGLSLVPSMQQSYNLLNSDRNIPRRWVWNFAPFLRYRYKLGKTRSIMVNYRSRSSQPSMAQLQPVPDYSNPLRVVVGNPNLNPSFTHYIRMRFQDFNADAQRSIMLMGDAQVAQNTIVSRTEYNSLTGGQTTTYANVNGVWSLRLMNMISQPLRNKHFTISNHLFVNLNHSVGYNNGLRNNSMATRLFESFSFAWRPDNVELELRPNYSLQLTHNSLPNISTPTIQSYGATFNGTYYTPFGVVLATDVSYTGTTGYANGYNQNTWMWNGSISYQFMHGKAATVALKVYDLLQQKRDISRTVTANFITDERFNTLTRYFMVTFTYRFNSFGQGNQPELRNDMRRGPGGPPPGMRRR